MCLVTSILNWIIPPLVLHVSFSVTVLQLNLLKPYCGFYELLGGTLDCGSHRLYSEIPLHGLQVHYSLGAFFYDVL